MSAIHEIPCKQFFMLLFSGRKVTLIISQNSSSSLYSYKLSPWCFILHHCIYMFKLIILFKHSLFAHTYFMYNYRYVYRCFLTMIFPQARRKSNSRDLGRRWYTIFVRTICVVFILLHEIARSWCASHRVAKKVQHDLPWKYRILPRN